MSEQKNNQKINRKNVRENVRGNRVKTGVARALTGESVVVHYPTLKTVLAIEDAVRKADSAVSRNKILAALPTKTMRSTLNVALDYLEKRGVVLETKNGFVWTFNANARLARAEADGLEV